MKFVDYEAHPKEKVYFIIKVIAAFFGYGILYLIISKIFNSGQQGLAFVPIRFYIVLIALYLFFRMGILIGYLKGNAKVSSHPRLTKRVGRVNVVKEIPLVANVEELYSSN